MYPIKGFSSISFHLDQDKTIYLQEILYVSGLKKNLISISALEDKAMKVAFINGKVLTWPMRSSMRDAFTLGSRFGSLYKVNGRLIHCWKMCN